MACLGHLHAQTLIEGTLLNESGKAVEGYVTVSHRATGTILSYANTDKQGHYRLSFETKADSVMIVAAGLGYGQETRVVANRSQRQDFRIEERSIALREVTVKAKKMRQAGDTIDYNVAAYTQQGDRAIADVLRRMPGMEVTAGGAIKFNGKSISKFYVEDLDLLQGRYGLATNNVSAKDVATVQVLENHQPVKALQGRQWSDDVAINLKLKKQAKGTINMNAMMGGGMQDDGDIGRNPLWNAELVGMHFAKRRQNITLYKTNNTGDDVSKELTNHYQGARSVSLSPLCPMAVVKPGGTGLPQKRTFDNRSHIMTLNHLEKLGTDSELGLNIAYYHDDVRQEGNSESMLFLSDSQQLHTQETLHSKTKTDELNLTARYNHNAKSNYIANVVKANMAWNTDRVDGLQKSDRTGKEAQQLGSNRTRQQFDRPQLQLSNTLNIIQNIGKDAFNLHLSLGYAQRPNTLEVAIDSLSQHAEALYRQDLTSRQLAGEFYSHYKWQLGAFALRYGLAANASLRHIATALDGFAADDHSTQNHLGYDTYELSLRQDYTFRQGSWNLSLGCPVYLYRQGLNDHILHDKRTDTRLFASPNGSISYDEGAWSGKVTARYDKTLGDPGGIYSGYVMGNYRSFQRSYVEHLSERQRLTTEAFLYFRNPLTATFVNLNANYTHAKNNQTYGMTYLGATTLVQAIDKPTCTATYQVGVDGSQGFNRWQTTVSVYANYRHTSDKRLIDRRVYPFRSGAIATGLRGSITPWSWMGIAWISDFAWHTTHMENNRVQTLRSSAQKITLTTFVTRNLTFTTTIEDSYNNLSADNRHTWFGDLSAKLQLKHVELEGQVNNLFNQQHYTRANYAGPDIYVQTAQLRSRNIILTIRFAVL